MRGRGGEGRGGGKDVDIKHDLYTIHIYFHPPIFCNRTRLFGGMSSQLVPLYPQHDVARGAVRLAGKLLLQVQKTH
jgi:hypothetical protein